MGQRAGSIGQRAWSLSIADCGMRILDWGQTSCWKKIGFLGCMDIYIKPIPHFIY